MLSFFRTNQLVAAFLLLGYVVVLRGIALFFHLPETAEPTGEAFFAELVLQFLNDNRVLAASLASALVFTQAILVNRLANNWRISNETSYFPGLFYALVASSLPEFLSLGGPLLATTFVILAIDQLLGTWNLQRGVAGRIFNIGFWLGIAALFYAPVLWLAAALLIGLNILRGFHLKERFMIFSGLLVPWLLAWVWFFWQNAGGWFWEKHLASGQFGLTGLFAEPGSPLLFAKIGLLALLTGVSMLGFQSFYSKKLIQNQKYVSIFYWILIVGAASFLFRPGFRLDHFLLICPVLGTFVGMSFLMFKNRGVAEVLHLLWLAVVVFLQIAR